MGEIDRRALTNDLRGRQFDVLPRHGRCESLPPSISDTDPRRGRRHHLRGGMSSRSVRSSMPSGGAGLSGAARKMTPAASPGSQECHQILGVHHATFGRIERRSRTWVRVRDENAVHGLQSLDSVGAPQGEQLLEDGHFVCVVCDDKLSAALVCHRFGAAEVVHEVASLHTQPRLERAGRIVEAGVNHAAVVRAGIEARAHVTLEHADACAGTGDRARRRQPCHAGADDRDFYVFHVNASECAGGPRRRRRA